MHDRGHHAVPREAQSDLQSEHPAAHHRCPTRTRNLGQQIGRIAEIAQHVNSCLGRNGEIAQAVQLWHPSARPRCQHQGVVAVLGAGVITHHTALAVNRHRTAPGLHLARRSAELGQHDGFALVTAGHDLREQYPVVGQRLLGGQHRHLHIEAPACEFIKESVAHHAVTHHHNPRHEASAR